MSWVKMAAKMAWAVFKIANAMRSWASKARWALCEATGYGLESRELTSIAKLSGKRKLAAKSVSEGFKRTMPPHGLAMLGCFGLIVAGIGALRGYIAWSAGEGFLAWCYIVGYIALDLALLGLFTSGAISSSYSAFRTLSKLPNDPEKSHPLLRPRDKMAANAQRRLAGAVSLAAPEWVRRALGGALRRATRL